jgi:alpha-galactosidase
VAARGVKNGPNYVRMIEQVHEVLDNLGTAFPEWAGLGYRIVGFGWHQGYNDRLNTVMSAGYEANLADLIQDLRREFGKPSLPVAIATTGMGISGAYSAVETAQLAVANPSSHPEFADTVFTRDTRPFWRDKTVSPADQSHHWNLNGESYYLIGQAMGQGMAGLPPP